MTLQDQVGANHIQHVYSDNENSAKYQLFQYFFDCCLVFDSFRFLFVFVSLFSLFLKSIFMLLYHFTLIFFHFLKMFDLF